MKTLIFALAVALSTSAFAQPAPTIQSRIVDAYHSFLQYKADQTFLWNEGLAGRDKTFVMNHVRVLEENAQLVQESPVKQDMLARAKRLRLIGQHRGWPVPAMKAAFKPFVIEEPKVTFEPVRDDVIGARMIAAHLGFQSAFFDEDVKAAHDPAYEALGCRVAMAKLMKSSESLGALQNRAVRDHNETMRMYPKLRADMAPRSMTERAVLCDAYHLIIDGRHVRSQHNVVRDDDLFKIAKGLK